MERISPSTTQPSTYTSSTKNELGFSDWKKMSLNEKRLSVIQASAGNPLGDRLKALDTRIITMTNQSHTHSSNTDTEISLLNEISLVRDEQYALQLQLKYLGCRFDETDTLTQVNKHLEKQLIEADKELHPATGKSVEGSLTRTQSRLITTVLPNIHLSLTENTHTQANNIKESLSEKIRLADHSTAKESADNALAKKQKRRQGRTRRTRRTRNLHTKATKGQKHLHLKNDLQRNDRARNDRARNNEERDNPKHRETAI